MTQALSFTHQCKICGGLFTALSLALIFAPGVVLELFELGASQGSEVVARRAGVIFGGLAFLMLTIATHPPSPTRRSIVLAIEFLLIGLAILGAIEFARGQIGPGVWLAITTETLVALLLWRAENATKR